MDYANRQTSLTTDQAKLSSDGAYHFVIAARDPGYPNWLDTASHRTGTIGVRWVGADVEDVLPKAKRMKIDAIG